MLNIHESVLFEVSTLVESSPPPFIYINDPVSPALTAKALQDSYSSPASGQRVRLAHLNAVRCFNARLFYDSALNALADWVPDWDNLCENWGAKDGHRYNDNFDSFLHGLTAIDAAQPSSSSDSGPTRFIISIENADRLKDYIPDLLIPLTRLAELVSFTVPQQQCLICLPQSRLDLCVIMISECRWEDIRPSLGASPDPYYIDTTVPSKDCKSPRFLPLLTVKCS